MVGRDDDSRDVAPSDGPPLVSVASGTSRFGDDLESRSTAVDRARTEIVRWAVSTGAGEGEAEMSTAPDWRMTRSDLVEGLKELGGIAARAGKIIDLCVYGGSCLMLVSNFRQASSDVDAVAVMDQRFVDGAAAEIAERRSWPTDWLNDGVRTYLSPAVDHPDGHFPAATYPSEEEPGLRVYVPVPEYMLAMKLMSMRIDELEGSKDLDDIRNLMSIVRISSKQQLMDLAADYYPEARVSAKLILSVGGLVEEARRRRVPHHETPKYLDRGGNGPGIG